MIETQFHTHVRVLRTDNSKEFFNTILGSYLQHHEIVHQSSCVNIPQQNGVSERKNRHLEVAHALLFTLNVPKFLWRDAVLTISYLINRLPSRPLNFCTPISVLTFLFPHIRASINLPLKTFGCIALMHIHDHLRSKLDLRVVKTVFLGYSPTQKGYCCYCPRKKKSFVSHYVTFFENTPQFSHLHFRGRTRKEKLVGIQHLFSFLAQTLHPLSVPLLSFFEQMNLPLQYHNSLPQCLNQGET